MKISTKNQGLNRILRGVGANGFSQLVTIFYQLLSIPVLTSSWGIDLYGIWLAISAIPAYLSMGGLGLGIVASNKLGMIIGSGLNYKSTEYVKVLSSFFWMTVSVVLLLTFLSLFAVLLYPAEYVPFSEYIASDYLIDVVWFLLLSVLIYMIIPVVDAIYRSNELFATGVVIHNSFRLLEYLLIIVSVYFLDFGLKGVVILMLISRCLSVIYMVSYAFYKLPGLNFSFNFFDLSVFKGLVKPIFSNFMLPLGSAFSIQGAVILGAYISPAFVAAFSITRTIVGFVKQFVMMYSNAIWPELSAAFGRGDMKSSFKMLFLGLLGTLFVFTFMGLFMYFFGAAIFEFMVSGDMFEMSIFLIVLLSVFLSTLQSQLAMFLNAANEMWNYSRFYFFSTVFAFFLGRFLVEQGGIEFMIPFILSDVLMVLLGFYLVRKMKAQYEG
jgi:O-antigen/teichoic acid export membrane protein